MNPGSDSHTAQGQRESIRSQVWSDLRKVALPDSRFHWDFSSFIADYAGSAEGAERIRETPAWQHADFLFITPDNNLEAVRRCAMEDGKPFVMSTYGIARGFLYLDPTTVGSATFGWAATLDGMERFARPVTLHDLTALGPFDLLVTGASAISMNGVRFGKGHGYFDLEWAMFSEIDVVGTDALVIGAGHDCQVVELDLPASEFDTLVDLIVTPTRTIEVGTGRIHRPGRIIWDKLEPEMITTIPPLGELQEMQAGEERPA